ncbi:MAG: hypothetical protein JW795_04615 [Chitinivibrionales bacterium]|nr:hypothetical protein [Chitinivibrionales bacterium]
MMSFDEELFEASLCIECDEWTSGTLSGLPTCKGVLLFCDLHDRPIQIMQAANLRRTARAKLVREPGTPAPRKADISSPTKKLFYVCCQNDFIQQLTYLKAAHAVFGPAAKDWIQLPKVSLAILETDMPLPYFYISDNPTVTDKRRVFGLFPTRKAASQFVDILNNVFTLCRNPALLETGKEASCPYLQMQTCPGPCLEKRLHTLYSESVRAALCFASGSHTETADVLRRKMNDAAKAMRFEEAALFKKKHEKLKKLAGPDFRWVHPLDKLCLLYIDTAGKRKRTGKIKKQMLYKAWKITARDVFELGAFVPLTNQQILSFLKAVWNSQRRLKYSNHSKEHLGGLSYFLFRSKNTGLWLDCTHAIPESIHILMHDEQGKMGYSFY